MDTIEKVAHPPIVSQEEWLADRKRLLTEEKELTRHKDRVNAQRRRLPMVKVDKNYVFEGPEGKKTLLELFEGRRQLIVYHFMYDPAWDKGCGGCTWMVNAFGDLSALAKGDTTLVLISRAPQEKLTAYKELKGWRLPWYSSFDNSFNYDYHVTLDESVAPMEYNYRGMPGLAEHIAMENIPGEHHGHSVFFRIGEDVYHTYSTYARGAEGLDDVNYLLDITPYGRQEDFEDSPEGWPQSPTYG